MKIVILLIILTFNLERGNCQESVTGCYASNFAIIGWFGMHIKLNNDSTFEYLYSGDLCYDKAYGDYTIEDNFIKLNFNLITDSLEITLMDSLDNQITYKLPKRENIAVNSRPTKLRYKKEKLITYDINGYRVRREMTSGNRRKKYYLVRHEDHGVLE